MVRILACSCCQALLVLLLMASGQAALAATAAMLQVSARVVHSCTIHVPARMPTEDAHAAQDLVRYACRGVKPVGIVREPVRLEPVAGRSTLRQVRFTPVPESRIMRITVTY